MCLSCLIVNLLNVEKKKKKKMITPSEFELYIVRKVARNPHLINETHDSVCLDNSYHRSVTDDQKQILASLHTDHATCTY